MRYLIVATAVVGLLGGVLALVGACSGGDDGPSVSSVCSAYCDYLEDCEEDVFEDEYADMFDCQDECQDDYDYDGEPQCESEWLDYLECQYKTLAEDCDYDDVHDACEDEYEDALDCDDEGGGGPSNPCTEAHDMVMQEYASACSSYLGECCMCDCIVTGSSSLPDCDCSDYNLDPPSGECTGSEEAAAQECLDDPDACLDGLEDMVDYICTL